MHVTEVEPVDFAARASELLLDCWARPCLHYTPAYLQWQASFPSRLPSQAVAAFDQSHLIGFAAGMPRRLAVGAFDFDAYLLSFVGVRDAYRGHGVASALYDALLGSIAARCAPIVTFTAPGSAGERCALRAYARAGFLLSPIGSLQGHGYAARRSVVPFGCAEEIDFAAYDALVVGRSATLLLRIAPTHEMLAHYSSDPRGCAAVGVRGADGQYCLVGLAVTAEYCSAHGIETAIIAENLLANTADPACLSALCDYVARRAPEPRRAVVSLPNLTGWDIDALRGVGIRQTGGSYNGYVASVDCSHPILTSTGTTIEVC